MDAQRFDTWTRAISSGMTRRGALGIVAGLLAMPWFDARLAAAKKDKVGICHLTSSAKNPVVFIEVDESAIPAHQAHGDTIDPDFDNDPNNCGGCGIVCEDDENDLCTTPTCVEGECGLALSPCPVGSRCCPDTGQCQRRCR